MTIELETPTAESVYEAVRVLPAAERIKLAGLLITNVSPFEIVDTSHNWTDEDLRDLDRATARLH